MKNIFKITGVALLFYAATLASQPEVKKAVSKEIDSLSFYYNISQEELNDIVKMKAEERKGGKKQ